VSADRSWESVIVWNNNLSNDPMRKALIKLRYKQSIDAAMYGWFEQGVINASFNEFLTSSLTYNPGLKYTTFEQMVANDEKASSLHYKCGCPLAPYIDSLKNNIPSLKDNTGSSIKFRTHQFKIVQSDVTDISEHKVALIYTTDVLTLLDSTDDHMLLAYGNKEKELTLMPDKPIENTFILKLVPELSIFSFEIILEEFPVHYLLSA
jgi:hypothetical protein